MYKQFLTIRINRGTCWSVAISGDSKDFYLVFSLAKTPKRSTPKGAGGVGPDLLCDLKPDAKFWKPTITPLEKSNYGGEKERKKERERKRC